jgi:hypothetical protein
MNAEDKIVSMNGSSSDVDKNILLQLHKRWQANTTWYNVCAEEDWTLKRVKSAQAEWDARLVTWNEYVSGR